MNEFFMYFSVVAVLILGVLISDSMRYLVSEMRFLNGKVGDIQREVGGVKKELSDISEMLRKRDVASRRVALNREADPLQAVRNAKAAERKTG